MAYTSITLPPFRGLNEDENPASLAPGELRETLNTSRKGRMIGTRPGLQYDGGSDYLAAISGAPAVQGIFEYRWSRDTQRKLVSVAGGNVYIDDTSGSLTKTGVTITSGQDFHWTFADYQNKLFAAGGDDGDNFWYWDGTGAAPGVIDKIVVLNSSAAAVEPKYVFRKWNFIFLGGMNGTTYDDNPLVARYCNYATDATDPTNWSLANTIPGQLLGENQGGGSYGSEYNTGFGSYQDNRGDFLLFLTNRRIEAFRQNPEVTSNANAFVQTDSIANGCVGQNAFVDLGFDQGDAIYVSDNGIHSLALSQDYGNRVTSFLSWPIRKTFASLNKARLKYTQTAYWPDLGIVLFLVSTGSNASHDLILCLDIKDAGKLSPDTVSWYKWRLSGVTANVLKAARDTDDKPYIYVGGTAGQIVRFDTSVYSDVGNTYSTVFRTQDETFGAPATEKSVGDAFVMVQGSGAYKPTHQFFLDDGEKEGCIQQFSVPSGGARYGVDRYDSGVYGGTDVTSRRRLRGIGSGYTISSRFSHSGENEPFWIGQMTQDVAAQGISDKGVE